MSEQELIIMKGLILLFLLLITACSQYAVQLNEVSFDAATNEISYEVTNPTTYTLECEISFRNIGIHFFNIEPAETKRFVYDVDLPEQATTNINTICKPII